MRTAGKPAAHRLEIQWLISIALCLAATAVAEKSPQWPWLFCQWEEREQSHPSGWEQGKTALPQKEHWAPSLMCPCTGALLLRIHSVFWIQWVRDTTWCKLKHLCGACSALSLTRQPARLGAQALTFAQIQFSRRNHLVNTQPATLDTALVAGFAPGFCTRLCLPTCAFNFRAVTVCANRLWRREVSLSSSENKKANLFRDVSSYGWWIKFTLSLEKTQTLNHLVKKRFSSWDITMAWKNPPSSLIELDMYLCA